MAKVKITEFEFASSCMAGTTVEYSLYVHVEEAVDAAVFGFIYRDGPADYIIYRDVWGTYAEVKKGERYVAVCRDVYPCAERGWESYWEFIIPPVEGTYTLDVIAGYILGGVETIEETRTVTVTASPFKPPKCSVWQYGVEDYVGMPKEWEANIAKWLWLYLHVDEAGGCPAAGLMYVDGPSPSIKYDVERPLKYELAKGGIIYNPHYHTASECSSGQGFGAYIAFPQPGDYTIALLAGYTDPAGTYNITDRRDFTITVFTPPTDFSISVSPSTLPVPRGQTRPADVVVQSMGGFSQPVTLTVLTPPGVTVTLSPQTVTPPPDEIATSTLMVTVDRSMLPGTYTITITGTSGELSHSTTLTLEVTTAPDFSLSVSPTSLTIQRGQSGTATVTVASIDGFSQPVTLGVEDVDPNITITFDPPTVTPPPDGSTTSTLKVTVGPNAPIGTHSIPIRGTSDEKIHYVFLTLQVTALPPPPVETASLTGKVTESILFGLIKRPSTGATVSIDTVKSTTTANGTYSLTDIPLGTYTVTVSKPWFETKVAQISLTEAGKTYTLDFEIPLSKWINTMAITAPIITVGTAVVKLKRKI
jgi:hypothetical protein